MLVADTKMLRVTVDPNARVVLEPCALECERQVYVFLPEGTKIFLGLDVEPNEIGPNRTYQLPQVEGSKLLPFRILKHQRLVGAADQGVVTFTLVVEHHKAG